MLCFTPQIDARALTIMMIFCQRPLTAWLMFMYSCTYLNEFKLFLLWVYAAVFNSEVPTYDLSHNTGTYCSLFV